MEGCIPLTRIQKVIGARMLDSKRSKPCFYIESGANVTELMALRPVFKKRLGVKVTTNAFYIFALSRAAMKWPLIAGGLADKAIRMVRGINVGFAVNAPQGLVVPVIRAANEKTLGQIAVLEKDLTDKARANILTLEDLEGETIAMSNLGVYGIDSFFGIVPPPAAAILSVGRVADTVVPVSGGFTVHKRVSLSIAADHRVVGSRYAANFLAMVVRLLESPLQMAFSASDTPLTT